MLTIECSRNMSNHIAAACSVPDTEYFVFGAPEYAAAKLCNTLWISAKSLYWALAKVEALGKVGSNYVVMSSAEYAARACYAAV